MRILIIILAISYLLPLQKAHASAAIEAQQRAVQQRQQQVIRARQQQIIQQQRQAYQRALVQRQRQIQQQAVNQAVASRAAQQQAYNQAVQQKVAQVVQQNQAAALSAQQQIASQVRAQQQAYQQNMQQAGVYMSEQLNQINQQYPPQQLMMQNVQQPGYGDLFYTPPVEEVVNITEIWKKMESESHAWNLMIDMEPKILTVQRMIDHFATQGVRVNKGPSHYVQLIDSMAFQNPEMLDQPFENILRVLAIMEYDYDNGQNKDALARQIFPDATQFRNNKNRLGL